MLAAAEAVAALWQGELSGTANSALCLADRTAQSIRRRSWPCWWAWTFASLAAQIQRIRKVHSSGAGNPGPFRPDRRAPWP